MEVKKSLTNWSELLLMHQAAFWLSEIARVSHFNVNLSSFYNLSFAILTCVGFFVVNFPETSRSFNRIEILKLLSMLDGLVNKQFVCLFILYFYLIFRVQRGGVRESIIQRFGKGFELGFPWISCTLGHMKPVSFIWARCLKRLKC